MKEQQQLDYDSLIAFPLLLVRGLCALILNYVLSLLNWTSRNIDWWYMVLILICILCFKTGITMKVPHVVYQSLPQDSLSDKNTYTSLRAQCFLYLRKLTLADTQYLLHAQQFPCNHFKIEESWFIFPEFYAFVI
jgi:hypothetical protein